MITNNRQAILYLTLIIFAIMLGGSAVGLLLADFGPPLAVRLALAIIPFTIIPFAIGLLYPALWWTAGIGTLLHLFLVISTYLTGPPPTLESLWLGFPMFLPFLLTFFFAYLGRSFHFSALYKRIHR